MVRCLSVNRNLSGIQFRHSESAETHRIHAMADGTEVGKMTWLKGRSVLDPGREAGEILNLDVHPDFRRRGIASEMYRHGRAHTPAPQHSPERTPEGTAWAHAVGGHVPPLDDAWDV